MSADDSGKRQPLTAQTRITSLLILAITFAGFA